MSRDSYKKAMFKCANVNPLTNSQRQELRKRKEEYKKSTNSIRQEIQVHRQEISKLEKKIEEQEIPSIPNAPGTHKTCGIRASIYFGTTPEGGLAGGESMSYCLFCDHEYESGD